MRSIPIIVAAVCVTGAPLAALAQASNEPGSLLAIQKRQFTMDNEIELSLAALPLDPFTKTYTAEASYTYHFNDFVAWEVVRGFFAQSFKTSLRVQAEEDYNVDPNTFEEYRFGVSSSIEVAPAYGKFSLLNDNVLHAEFLLAVGPMVAWMFQKDNLIKVGPVGGFGVRVFANDTISVRVDTRYGVLFGTKKPSTNTLVCTLSLGVSFDFGHTD